MTADADVGAGQARQVASSTWLTAVAGMLLLVTAVVMMVCAAPRPHAAQHVNAPGDQLVSWVYFTPHARDAGPVAPVARPRPQGRRPARQHVGPAAPAASAAPSRGSAG